MKGLWITQRAAWAVRGSEQVRRGVRVARSIALIVVMGLALLRFDTPPRTDLSASLDRALGVPQFDFVSWWLGAVSAKLSAEAVPLHRHLTEAQQSEYVREYLERLEAFRALEAQVEAIYTDPKHRDPELASTALRAQRDALRAELDARQTLVESILQAQIESVLREEGFAVGGQVFPPLRFRFTAPPDLLVISRRDRIMRIDSRALAPGLTVDEKDRLERRVDRQFNVSSLVVRLGGLAAYPTMIAESTSLQWLVEVAAHEWVHNYLAATLSWVGLSILSDPVALTINETAANIVGKEVAPRVLRRYYPESVAELAADARAEVRQPQPKFDFRKEMRETRLRVDALLEAGQIEEAEAYMEERRRLFVANGYPIRKLNQAYFAFHGAYNDEPGGAPAAGRDPVGPAVQALRQRSASLGEFLRTVASLRSFEDLQARLR